MSSTYAIGYGSDPNQDLQCPYIPSHMVRGGSRMQRHLMRCRSDLETKPTHLYYKNLDLIAICPFNNSHHVPKEKLLAHLAHCPDSKSVQEELWLDDEDEKDLPSWKKKANAAGQADVAPPPASASFADDVVEERYNPRVHKVDEAWGDDTLLVNVNNLPEAQKRDTRMNRRALAGPEVEFGARTETKAPVSSSSRVSSSTVPESSSSSGIEVDDEDDFVPSQSQSQPPQPATDDFPALRRPRTSPAPVDAPIGDTVRGRGRGRGRQRDNNVDDLSAAFTEQVSVGRGRGGSRGRGPPPGFPESGPGRGSAPLPPVSDTGAGAWGRGRSRGRF